MKGIHLRDEADPHVGRKVPIRRKAGAQSQFRLC